MSNARRIIIAKKGALSKEDIRKIEKNFSIVIECNPDDIKIISTLYEGETSELIQAIIKKADYSFSKDNQALLYYTILNEITKKIPKANPQPTP